MNINDLKTESNFLKKEDLTRPVKVTIADVKPIEFDGKTKLDIGFKDKDKRFVCNPTNMSLIAASLGTPMTEEWIGKEITLYNDPTVKMGNDVVGGIRVQYVVPVSDDELNDDIPF